MDKSIIEQLAKPVSDESVKDFYHDIALPVIYEALDEVSKTCEIINENNIKIFPIGEYTNETFIDETGGELEIVIACSNPQLTLSNKSFEKEYAKASKKEKQEINIKNTSEDIIKSLYKAFLQQFSSETTLILYAQGIKILCKKEVGFNMLIRFASYSEDDEDLVMHFWNTIKKDSDAVNIYAYSDNISEKNLLTKGNYAHFVRVLKSYRKTMLTKKWISSNKTTRYLVEALAYNIPTKLLVEKDFYKAYTKGMMYLLNAPLNALKSFDGKPINKCPLINANYNTVKTFLNNLARLDA